MCFFLFHIRWLFKTNSVAKLSTTLTTSAKKRPRHDTNDRLSRQESDKNVKVESTPVKTVESSSNPYEKIVSNSVEKYQTAKLLCKSLALLLSQVSDVKFQCRIGLLKDVQKSWLKDKEVQLAQSIESNKQGDDNDSSPLVIISSNMLPGVEFSAVDLPEPNAEENFLSETVDDGDVGDVAGQIEDSNLILQEGTVRWLQS